MDNMTDDELFTRKDRGHQQQRAGLAPSEILQRDAGQQEANA